MWCTHQLLLQPAKIPMTAGGVCCAWMVWFDVAHMLVKFSNTIAIKQMQALDITVFQSSVYQRVGGEIR